MALGFPPKYSEELILTGINEKELYALAYQTAEKLNWHIEHTAKHGFIIITSNNPLESQHEMSLVFEEGKIKIHCISISNFFYDFGRNKKLIEKFISWLNKQLTSFEPTLLQEKYALLELEFLKESANFLADDPLAHYRIEKRFYHAFVPHSNYVFTPVILYINLILFLLVWATGGGFLLPSTEVMTFWGANFKSLTINGEPWRIISCAFLHFGFFHFIMNMYALLNIGMILEPEIKSKNLGLGYFLTILAAGSASLYWNDFVISAGASGAIFGLYGIFIALFSSNVITNKARKAMLFSVLIFTAYTLLDGLKSGQVDNVGHFSGFASGLIIGFAIVLHRKYQLNNFVRPVIYPVLVVLFLSFTSFSLLNSVDKSVEYTTLMNKFIVNEEKALVVYYSNYNTPVDTIKKMLKDEGLVYWKENLKIALYLQSADLPDRLLKKNELVTDYCIARIEAYSMIYAYLNHGKSIRKFLSYEYNQKTQDLVNQIKQAN